MNDDLLFPQVSVYVSIYNASWERIKASLNSIILQKDIDFEIIIVDDCSEVNHSDKIKDFFSRNDFKNYTMINHEKNLGVIRTYLDAAEHARAKYIRCLGQGDMFSDEYALRDSYNYMVSTDSELTISKYVHFRANSNPIEIFESYRFPQNIKAYDNPDDLRESYLLHDDLAPGATAMYRRDMFIQYMKEAIEGGLKCLEDYMFRCMIFDKRRIKFFDRNVMFYEFGAGITTTKNKDNPYNEVMLSDEFNMNTLLLKRCGTSPSDEFSKRLASRIHSKRKIRAEIEYRKSLKDRFGIAAVPVILARRLLRGAMIALGLEMKAEVPPEIEVIMTDTNVSTDFANLCMNRE